jgi:hypothetical protein
MQDFAPSSIERGSGSMRPRSRDGTTVGIAYSCISGGSGAKHRFRIRQGGGDMAG